MPAPLLVVVDMQDVFRDPESPWATPFYDRAARGVDRLVAAMGDRVVFTRFVPPAEMPGSWGPYYETFADVLRPEHAGRWELSAAYRDAARVDERSTVVRSTFSAWGERLRDAAGDPAVLLLCGVTTDCCVISTALAAVDAGAFVRVVADACGGSSESSHEAALTVLRGYAPQVDVSTVDRELGRLADRATSI